MEEVIETEGRRYILADSARLDRETTVLKGGDTFAVFDRAGDLGVLPEHGLFHEGTRYLSRLQLTLGGRKPLLLASGVTPDNLCHVAEMTNPEIGDSGQIDLPRGRIQLSRETLVAGGTLHVRLTARHFEKTEQSLELEFAVGGDFADLFEVRGQKRPARGKTLAPSLEAGQLTLAYEGLDNVTRRCILQPEPAPSAAGPGTLSFVLEVPPGGEASVEVSVVCRHDKSAPPRVSYATAFDAARSELEDLVADQCIMSTSNEQLDVWIHRSMADLRMLSTRTSHGRYPYAGVPWYSTVFGRDGILTALSCLWLDSEMAHSVLELLASLQATVEDPARDAQPGKIVHEVRAGEMAALGEHVYGRYYGTVDATPLFVMLAGAYLERTGDRAFAKKLWPAVEKALAWLDKYGDLDGDGLIEYRGQAAGGLANQGWKDSGDAIFHADGSLARGPIAVCEVQGYAYAARLAGAALAHASGHHEAAAAHEQAAEKLRERFEETFWCDDLGTYALALDGDKRPCKVVSSNAGHVLFTGLASRDRAARVAQTLMRSESFSGWGIRTVASDSARYNPMSYHNGSVWPHDTGIVAAGLAKYGHKREALTIFEGLFAATRFSPHGRLPELFCGFERRPGLAPTPYPVACSPQAWSAATLFLMLDACLGMEIRHGGREVVFKAPAMPHGVRWIEFENFETGHGQIELALQDTGRGVEVDVLRGASGVTVMLED